MHSYIHHIQFPDEFDQILEDLDGLSISEVETTLLSIYTDICKYTGKHKIRTI